MKSPSPPPLPPVWASATLAKAHAAASENEDAAASQPKLGRFALSDGATEGWQSGPWAGHLATAYARRPPTPADFPRWLADARKTWVSPDPAGPVAWYAEAKREQGSFATLLGVEISPGPDGVWKWRAVAVGDTCLLVVRGGRVAVSFPVEAADGFGNAPPLVPSAAARPCPEPEWLAGTARPGDALVLATDAAAAGLLRADTGLPARAAGALDRESAHDRATDLLGLCRALQALQNDDVTLLAVLVPGQSESRP